MQFHLGYILKHECSLVQILVRIKATFLDEYAAETFFWNKAKEWWCSAHKHHRQRHNGVTIIPPHSRERNSQKIATFSSAKFQQIKHEYQGTPQDLPVG
jgi:hypothetical protein